MIEGLVDFSINPTIQQSILPMLKTRIVKIRWIKPYPEAHNHIAIGEVVDETNIALKVNCRTYHFGKTVDAKNCELKPGKYVGGVLAGKKAIRVIPWNRIEVMHQLSDDTDWDVTGKFDSDGNCVLKNENKTLIARPRDDGD